MNTAKSIVPASLDLANPSDFLLALYHVENWPARAAWSDERFGDDILTVESCLPMVFDKARPVLAIAAVEHMISLLSTSLPIDRSPPREWLAVFRAAFHRGLFGSAVWGAIVTSLLTTIASGNGSPEHATDSIEAKLQSLDDVRRAHPTGLMDETELAAWRALPATVIAYRGGCTSKVRPDGLVEARNGLHWALEEEIAGSYMLTREQERTDAYVRGATATFAARLGQASVRMASPVSVARPGHPFLIRAELPRSAVLAYCARGLTSPAGVRTSYRELMVDFARITPAMVTDITPTADRLAA